MGDLPGAGAPGLGGGEEPREGRTRFGGGMLVAALKSRYFRHRCYRCFLHSVSSVTINEVTDQSGAGVVVVAAVAFLPWRCARMFVPCSGNISLVGIGIMRHMDCVIAPFVFYWRA